MRSNEDLGHMLLQRDLLTLKLVFKKLLLEGNEMLRG